MDLWGRLRDRVGITSQGEVLCHDEVKRVGAGAAWSGIGALVAARRALWRMRPSTPRAATRAHPPHPRHPRPYAQAAAGRLPTKPLLLRARDPHAAEKPGLSIS